MQVLPNIEDRIGFEPMTFRFQGDWSTNSLSIQWVHPINLLLVSRGHSPIEYLTGTTWPDQRRSGVSGISNHTSDTMCANHANVYLS